MTLYKLILCLAAASVLASCGSPGVPLPPSLELAKPITDLRAVRKGDKVYLTWTAPTLTTDRHVIKHPGATEICRRVAAGLHECGTPVAKVAPMRATVSNSQSKPEASYTDQLPSDLQNQNPTSSISYAVSVLNSYGRSAGFSNQVQVPAAPTLPPPNNFHAELTPEGVSLVWTPSAAPEIPGLRFAYRVYRREQGGNKDAIAGEIPVAADSPATLLDRSFEWEKTYSYRATIVTLVADQSVEGEDTSAVSVAAHDIFPPAAPSGLQAVFAGPGQKLFIDLVWTPNSESDLAGYNVYRHEQGAAPARVNTELIKTPAFRDTDVNSGRQYFYSITAVDVRGNESAHSEEASETVP